MYLIHLSFYKIHHNNIRNNYNNDIPSNISYKNEEILSFCEKSQKELDDLIQFDVNKEKLEKDFTKAKKDLLEIINPQILKDLIVMDSFSFFSKVIQRGKYKIIEIIIEQPYIRIIIII